MFPLFFHSWFLPSFTFPFLSFCTLVLFSFAFFLPHYPFRSPSSSSLILPFCQLYKYRAGALALMPLLLAVLRAWVREMWLVYARRGQRRCVTSWPPCYQSVIKGRRSCSSVDVRRCWILIRTTVSTREQATKRRSNMAGTALPSRDLSLFLLYTLPPSPSLSLYRRF
jgi:hypothetical protein